MIIQFRESVRALERPSRFLRSVYECVARTAKDLDALPSNSFDVSASFFSSSLSCSLKIAHTNRKIRLGIDEQPRDAHP